MNRGITALAAIAIALVTAVGVALGGSTTATDSYESLLPRVLTASGDPTFGDDAHELAMTYGLVASAAAAAGDDSTADMAADWLIDDMGSGGWGTAWTWDPFGDGSMTPASTPYSVTTAIAIQGLLDRGVDRILGRRLADVTLRWARDGWSNGYYWFSMAPQDAVYTPNVSAMMAGITARLVAEHPDLFSADERALLTDRVRQSIKRLGTGDAGYLRWIYSDRHDVVNDLNHHGYILWGMEMARDSGFDIPWSRADALRSLTEYDGLYPIGINLTTGMSNRYGSSWMVSGTGTALTLVARYGSNVRPWVRRACVALDRSAFYPRFAAHTLLGLALAGSRDSEPSSGVSAGAKEPSC